MAVFFSLDLGGVPLEAGLPWTPPGVEVNIRRREIGLDEAQHLLQAPDLRVCVDAGHAANIAAMQDKLGFSVEIPPTPAKMALRGGDHIVVMALRLKRLFPGKYVEEYAKFWQYSITLVGAERVIVRDREGGVLYATTTVADLGPAVAEAVQKGVSLRRAYLPAAGFTRLDLRGADLREAKLNEAVLCMADLRGADLSGADLRSTDMAGARLEGANLEGADMQHARRHTILDEYREET